jgi:CheY-like chemotaxis protein
MVKVDRPIDMPNVLKGKRILIVDDIIENQMLESIYLKKVGAEVECAGNGLEAVEKAMCGTHDAILMDLHMPYLDGITATVRLREKGYQKPIIAITADGRHSIEMRAQEVGFSDYLVKPLYSSDLIEALMRLLNLYQPQYV